MVTNQPQSIKIRILKPSDFDSYFALRLESLEKSPEMYATDANDWQNAPKESIERHLTLSESGEVPIFSAWDGDKLVGLVGLMPDKRPTVQHKATIWGMFVTPDYRRQGIGTALLATAVNTARERPQLEQLRAVVNATNQQAVNLFQWAGFQQFGHEPNAKYINNQYHDQIYFWYQLRHDS